MDCKEEEHAIWKTPDVLQIVAEWSATDLANLQNIRAVSRNFQIGVHESVVFMEEKIPRDLSLFREVFIAPYKLTDRTIGNPLCRFYFISFCRTVGRRAAVQPITVNWLQVRVHWLPALEHIFQAGVTLKHFASPQGNRQEFAEILQRSRASNTTRVDVGPMSIDFTEPKQVTFAYLPASPTQYLKMLPNKGQDIEVIKFTACCLDAADFQAVAALPNLRELTVTPSRITGLGHLAGSKSLKKLDLTKVPIAQDEMDALATNLALEDVNFSECAGFTSLVAVSANCLALVKINASQTSLSQEGIAGIEHLPKLEDLDLGHCASVVDVSALKSCKALKKLSLWRTSKPAN